MDKEKIDPEKFGDALKAWCKTKRVSIARLARQTCQNPANLYAYTKHSKGHTRTVPTLVRALELADALEITLEELARGPFGEGLVDD